MNPRQLALETLLKIEQNNSYSNLSVAGALKNNSLEGAVRILMCEDENIFSIV